MEALKYKRSKPDDTTVFLLSRRPATLVVFCVPRLLFVFPGWTFTANGERSVGSKRLKPEKAKRVRRLEAVV